MTIRTLRHKGGARALRNPFPAIKKTEPTKKKKTGAAKQPITGAAARADSLLITGIMLGRKINAVRIFGRRVNVGEEFDYDEKKSARDKISVVRGGEFKLRSVSAKEILIEHVDGDVIPRETSIWAQPKEEPQPAASPAAKQQQGAGGEESGGTSSSPSPGGAAPEGQSQAGP